MNNMTKAFAVSLVLASLMACSQEAQNDRAETPKAAAPTPAPVTLPADLFPATAPADAKPLTEVRGAAKTGDVVTMTGYIGGREAPFTEGRALFQMVDTETVPVCTDHEDATWDACCTPKKTIAANSATIQVVDAAGQTLKIGLDGKGNLAPGSTITVSGKVRELSNEVMIVDATAIYTAKAN